jgi:heme-degrading monooxygenase HmoA
VSVVVVFTSRRSTTHDEEYEARSARMTELVRGHPGFIEMTSVRDPRTREGVTVAYFEDEESVRAWKAHAEHAEAQSRGIAALYEDYHVTVATVTRQYGMTPVADPSD